MMPDNNDTPTVQIAAETKLSITDNAKMLIKRMSVSFSTKDDTQKLHDDLDDTDDSDDDVFC